jgi:hypothetical protein
MGCNGLGKHSFSVSYSNRRFHFVYKNCQNRRMGYYNLEVGDLLATISSLAVETTAGESPDMDFTWRARRKLGPCAGDFEAELAASDRYPN